MLNEPVTKPKQRRGWRAVGILLLVGVLCGLSLIGWVVYKEHTLPPVQPSQAIIVLGAQVKPNGTMSEMLRRRVALALDAYRQDPQLIITCGAQGQNEPDAEGAVMKAWLVQNGVPEQQVIAETRSVNTRQNLLFAQEVMQSRGLNGALVITSDYHVARALALCDQLGLPATGMGAKTDWTYIPKNYSREALSWVKFWLQSLFLGEAND